MAINSETPGTIDDEPNMLPIIRVRGYDEICADHPDGDPTMRFDGPAVFPGTPPIVIKVPWLKRSKG